MTASNYPTSSLPVGEQLQRVLREAGLEVERTEVMLPGITMLTHAKKTG
jgi:hypothetical protein